MKLEKRIILNVIFALALFSTVISWFDILKIAVDLFTFRNRQLLKIFGILSVFAMGGIISFSLLLAARKNSKKPRLFFTIGLACCLSIFIIFLLAAFKEDINFFASSMFSAVLNGVLPVVITAAILSGISIYCAFSNKDKNNGIESNGNSSKQE